MAYLLDITPGKCAWCHQRMASVELFNRYNAPVAKFCKKCGAKKLASLIAAEVAPIVAGVKPWP